MLALNNKFWWYASRASGLILWLILATGICWGLAITARMIRRRGMAAWMLDLHRHLGTLGLVFTGVHPVSLWADNFVHFGAKQLFIPMASTWRPGAVMWGIITLYLLVIVQTSSWFMKPTGRGEGCIGGCRATAGFGCPERSERYSNGCGSCRTGGAAALTPRLGPMDAQEPPETGGFVVRIRRVS